MGLNPCPGVPDACCFPRQNQNTALPFGGLGITNCKSTERSRYGGDWPNWTYTQYSNSYDFAQVSANGNVPNYHGITEFITARRTNALNQLQLSNIAPIISALSVAPTLPATNQLIKFTARVEDDVSVSAVNDAMSEKNTVNQRRRGGRRNDNGKPRSDGGSSRGGCGSSAGAALRCRHQR